MRMIDADNAVRKLQEYRDDVCRTSHKHLIASALISILTNPQQCPTIDSVHAAGACYCGECRYCVHQPGIKDAEWICVERHTYCDCGAKIVTPNHFCSHGEKKHNEEVIG